MSAPQACPRCKADLSDPTVPPVYADKADLFTQAQEVAISQTAAMWRCPLCLHVWGQHRRPVDLEPPR